jgi:hypothetical protein
MREDKWYTMAPVLTHKMGAPRLVKRCVDAIACRGPREGEEGTMIRVLYRPASKVSRAAPSLVRQGDGEGGEQASISLHVMAYE